MRKKKKSAKMDWLKHYRRIDKATEYAVLERLLSVAGERGKTEGMIDVLDRLIYERNRALHVLALDRLRE